MKKTTTATVISAIVFTLAIAPTITAQAQTIPFLASITSILDTINTYVPIVNSILAGGTPSSTELAASKAAVSNDRIYGVTGIGASFTPLADDGEINLDPTVDDDLTVKAADKANIKTRSIGEFQSVAELATYQTATRAVGIAAAKTETNNKNAVAAAQTAMTKADNTVRSLPIGTCDSSLCAENTHNTLIAQQIALQSAEMSLAIVGNAYSKINNNQQAILVKNEQDKKAQEVVKARLDSITGGSDLYNRYNANKLIRTAYYRR